jgi:hypothetical protein
MQARMHRSNMVSERAVDDDEADEWKPVGIMREYFYEALHTNPMVRDRFAAGFHIGILN